MSFLFNTHNRSSIAFSYGQGCYLFDTENNKYLDFASGIAVNSLGHCHPKVNKALKAQANKLWHISNLYTINEAESFAKQMCEATFADKAFFCNSGAEAVECMIKTIRRYFYLKNQSQKNRIITFKNSFHGRTMATVCASANYKYMEGFAPFLDGFDCIDCGDIELVKKTITHKTAGIIIEPVQGEGGVNFVGATFLQQLRQICSEQNIILALDEVQCGMGRTGALFAYEHAGIKPDILAFAKGIANGFPLGGCLASEDVASAITPGTHGTTYGGNPLAMAVGSCVFGIISDSKFLKNVKETTNYLDLKLKNIVAEHPNLFVKLRGLGHMRGIECSSALQASAFVEAARTNNLLLATAGQNVIRILPPLIIGKPEIEEFADSFNKTIKSFAL